MFVSFKPLTGGVYSAYIEVTSTSPDSPFILKLAGSAKDDQIINFQNPGDQITTNVLSLTATASSALPVSYTVSSLGILNDSSLTFLGSESVTVTARQVGNEMRNPATDVKQVFNVSKAEQAPLFFQPVATTAYMISTQLTLAGGSGTGLVVYSVLSGPATLQGVTLTVTNGSGTVVVQALKYTDCNVSGFVHQCLHRRWPGYAGINASPDYRSSADHQYSERHLIQQIAGELYPVEHQRGAYRHQSALLSDCGYRRPATEHR